MAAVIGAVWLVASLDLDLAYSQDPEPVEELGGVSEQASFNLFGLEIRDWTYLARIAQGVFTVAAIVVGGIFAWRNAHIFRHNAPHVNVSHEITHIFLSDEYVYIAVTATLHNTSRVNIEFLNGYSRIQQVTPIENEEIENLYGEAFFQTPYPGYLQWPTLDYHANRWEKDGLTVEPGEKETQAFEFIVSREVESVIITTYFYNSRVVGEISTESEMERTPRRRGRLLRWKEVEGPRGWGRTTTYVIPSNQDLL